MNLTEARQIIRTSVEIEKNKFLAAGNPCVCKRGCGDCCKSNGTNIVVSNEEVDLISNLNISIDTNLLISQNETPMIASKRCVFLSEDNVCKLHELNAKPLSCENHNVKGTSSFCLSGKNVSYIKSPDADRAQEEHYKVNGKLKLHEELYKRSQNNTII